MGCQRASVGAGADSPEATPVLHQENYGSIGINFIAVTPEHPVLVRALTMGTIAINSDLIWLSTGLGLLTRATAFVRVRLRRSVGLKLVVGKAARAGQLAVMGLSRRPNRQRVLLRAAPVTRKPMRRNLRGLRKSKIGAATDGYLTVSLPYLS